LEHLLFSSCGTLAYFTIWLFNKIRKSGTLLIKRYENNDMNNTSPRAGRRINQPAGYKAFIPTPLPPEPPIATDDEMIELLSKAARALGRLDGVVSVLPHPDLLVAMYVRHEAVLSSQIRHAEYSRRRAGVGERCPKRGRAAGRGRSR
jgi:hypothetical protein